MGIEQKGEKFLQPSDYGIKRNPNKKTGDLGENKPGEKVQEWQEVAKNKERGERYEYNAVRIGNAKIKESSVEYLHGNIIEKFIDTLIEKKRNIPESKRIKVLVLGAGAGLYVDELRKKIGDMGDVYSTGLRKHMARKMRQEIAFGRHKIIQADSTYKTDVEPQLHPQDLKWRSIMELHNFSEFDLIVDTFGEAFYTRSSSMEYLDAVISKLNLGGLASIYPGDFGPEFDTVAYRNIEKEYGVQITFGPLSDRDKCTMNIKKLDTNTKI